MVRILLVLAVLLFSISSTFAAIQVRVDKTQISSIDSLRISIRDDTLSGNQVPDISALKADFNIINQSQSSSFSAINGKTFRAIELQLVLKPKRIGELTIPAFTLGKQTSKPIKIKVSKVNEASFENNILFIKTKISNKNPLVQQQIIYTVSLFSNENVKDAPLDFAPKMLDTKVKKIAKQSIHPVKFKGRQLWRQDFNFAIYPQKAGGLRVPAINLDVNLTTPSKRRTVKLFSEAINLTVAPAHPSYPAGEYWLPATDVKISEKPFANGQKIVAGEPFVRQITIKISAQSANQVPAIKLQNSTLFEQYPDSHSNSEKLTNANIISTSKQNILLIAKHSGEQILPEISLNWFDTNDNKTKIARLPAVKIQVGKPLVQPKTLVLHKFENKDISLKTNPKQPKSQPTYWKPAALFSITLWLLTLLFCWFYRQSKSTQKLVENNKTAGANQLKMIKEYANKNDAKAAKNALDTWIFEQYNLLDTNKFAAKFGAEFAAEILILQQNLYKSNAKWNGKKFYQVFAKTLKNHPPKPPKQLENLYPDSV
ncbi:MAG: protein BatD [Candidatus Thioglobus sp.]|nr:protein BatD [Candidatus Thioglobus sp.]